MRRAFTLIELLVVIAIIAILAAILFPVFAQAKAAAKKTADLSNQKNIGTGMILYASDYDDMYPRQVYKVNGRNNGNGWNIPFTWREAVLPYIKNGSANYGTAANQQIVADGGIFDTPAKPGARGSYTTNRNLSPGYCYWDAGLSNWMCDSTDDGLPTGVPSMPSVSNTQLDAPAQIVATFTMGINPDWNASGDFSEASWWWFGGAAWPPVFSGAQSGQKWDADSNVFPHWSMPRYRYTEGQNTSFADGHAKYVKKGAFNWCSMMYIKNTPSDRNDNWEWLFSPGSFCAAYAR